MSILVPQRNNLTEGLSEAMLAKAAEFGCSAVRPEEFEFVHDMAGALMKHEVSSADTFRAVQAIQPASSLCYREDGQITGVLGILLLRSPAADQLMSGEFDGVDVDLELLSRAGEQPAIGYGWGIAATTRTAGAALSALGMPIRLGPLARLTFVIRAVTGAGRHVSMTRFGYRPMRHENDDMLISYAEVLEAAE